MKRVDLPKIAPAVLVDCCRTRLAAKAKVAKAQAVVRERQDREFGVLKKALGAAVV